MSYSTSYMLNADNLHRENDAYSITSFCLKEALSRRGVYQLDHNSVRHSSIGRQSGHRLWSFVWFIEMTPWANEDQASIIRQSFFLGLSSLGRDFNFLGRRENNFDI